MQKHAPQIMHVSPESNEFVNCLKCLVKGVVSLLLWCIHWYVYSTVWKNRWKSTWWNSVEFQSVLNLCGLCCLKVCVYEWVYVDNHVRMCLYILGGCVCIQHRKLSTYTTYIDSIVCGKQMLVWVVCLSSCLYPHASHWPCMSCAGHVVLSI